MKYYYRRNVYLFSFLVFLLFFNCNNKSNKTFDLIEFENENWPMASGPEANWITTTKHKVPTKWSVSNNENILWKTILPEGGQSGIAIWEDKLFLTINELIPKENTNVNPESSDIIGYCINANTGHIEWTATIPGTKKRKHSGLFSDNTSPTPATDGKHVWFINGGGTIACFDMNGNAVWSKSFETRGRHAAKQCEPILINNQLLYVTVRDKGDLKRKGINLPINADKRSHPEPETWPWTYIRSFDALTGKLLWTESSGTSVHNTPGIGFINDKGFVFHIRGGGHEPPETPYGFSMTQVTGDKAGKLLWSYPAAKPLAYTSSQFNEQFTYGINSDTLLKLESTTGKLINKFPLFDSATIYKWDTIIGEYKTYPNASFKTIVKKFRKTPTNHTTILVGKYYLFLTHRGHCIGRVDTETGKVEYLQVPIQVKRGLHKKDSLMWTNHIPSSIKNSRGIETTAELRAKGDGWGNVTPGCPIAINKFVFFSTMIGMTYVVNSQSEIFDESALISINDLGPAGKTWSLSTLSYANGKIYHRGLKHLVCIKPTNNK